MSNSVFAAWYESPDLGEKAFENDKKLWRLSRFIKDEEELKRVERAIE